MAKGKNKTGELIKSLRFAFGDTQGKFARRLRVTQSMVSAWEGERDAPSAVAAWKLGALAAKQRMYDTAFAFWSLVGGEGVEEQILAASDARLRHRGLIQGQGEVFRLTRFERSLTEFGERLAGPDVPLPVEFITDPGQTRCYVVGKDAANPWFGAGDVIVLDESRNDSPDLTPFWDRVVLAEFAPRDPEDKVVEVRGWWPTGCVVGLLSLEGEGGVSFSARLDVLGQDPLRPIDIGFWDYPPSDPKRQLNEIKQWKHTELKKVAKDAAQQARTTVKLLPGVRILGRAVGWLRAPEKKSK